MLTIGALKIRMPAIRAALSGFSDRPMRAVARRYGAEFAMAEVVLDELVRRRPVTLKMRRGFDDSAESERRFFSILDGAFELGAAL